MPEDVPPGLTPFVFSDPLGKRWPRLRILLLITGMLVFLGTVLFVETLFIAPRMTAPFSLRLLKGQLKSLQTQNPAGKPSAPNSLLWQKFEATKQAAKKLAGPAAVTGSPTATPARAHRKASENEVRLAFYTNGDPYSYSSLEQHAGWITSLEVAAELRGVAMPHPCKHYRRGNIRMRKNRTANDLPEQNARSDSSTSGFRIDPAR